MPRRDVLAAYTVAIELEGGSGDGQYELLNTLMSTIGFVRGVRASDGTTYRLPPALYFGSSDYEIGTVRDIVFAVTERVGACVVIFVAQTAAWAAYASH